MPKSKLVTNVKDVLALAALTYTSVKAAQGWIAMHRGVKEVLQDKLNTK